MNETLALLVGLLLKSAVVLFAANEVRGLVLAAPVLYAMYASGGTLMALWLGFCSLAGIVLSVVMPLLIAKRVRLLQPRLA